MTNGANAENPSVNNIEAIIASIKEEFPEAGIHITGRARTVRRQAELMALRIRGSRQDFLGTYIRHQHIREMDVWYLANQRATVADTTAQFERYIRQAIARGATVSNHLSDTARDISWPVGDAATLDRIEARIQQLGATVIREDRSTTGKHWHID